MPILDIQRSLRKLGRLRMGETKTTGNGKSFPAKLEQWRITSPSPELIEAAAEVYGGEPHTWDNPAGGREWEVYTESDTVRVIIPARRTLRTEEEPPEDTAIFSQWYEQWSAGGCQRRCDGFTETLSGQACMCPLDQEERQKLAARGNACKMTTRLSVMLPDIPDIGVWMLESHGYYAAVELAGAYEIILPVVGAGRMVPAQIRIEQRTRKVEGKTRNWVVPVVEVMGATAGMLTTGEAPAALPLGQPVAIGGPPARALSSGGAPAARQTPAPPRTTGSNGNGNGGPPQPPLPHEIEGAAADPAPAAVPSADPPDDGPLMEAPQRVAMWCRDAGLDDDGRHRFLTAFSNGEYASAKDVPPDHMEPLREELDRLKDGGLRLDERDGKPVLIDTRFGWPQGNTAPDAPAAPAPRVEGEWTKARWETQLEDVPGIGPVKLLKQARFELAPQLGVSPPNSLDELTDPALVEACLAWLETMKQAAA